MNYLAGIDIGGTNVVCGLVDIEGKLIRKKKLPTEAEKGSEFVVAKITDMIKNLLIEERIGLDSIIAAGMGTPGFVDPIQGINILASNLHWENIPLARMLSNQIHAPVFIDNDVRMYIFGEAMVGAGQGYEQVLGITIGTGLAAAAVNKGVLYYGNRYLAGELGHIPMDGVSEICNCGLTGCLETIVSATGIVRQATQAIESGQMSILKQKINDLKHITALDVSKAYDLGDELAIKVIQYTGKMLGRGLSYAVPLLSPEIIVIGGGAAMAGERLFAPMRKEMQRIIHPMYWEQLVIKPARFLEDAGVIGSALYAQSRM